MVIYKTILIAPAKIKGGIVVCYNKQADATPKGIALDTLGM